MEKKELSSTEPSGVRAPNRDEMRLRDVFELARREIIRGKARTALELLRANRKEAEEHRGTQLWAEYTLLLAEAFAGKSDECAEGYFEDALQFIKNLADPDADLEARAHESFGNFLTSTLRIRSKARQQYELARQIATKHNLRTRNAEIELKIIQIDLETDGNSELKNFSAMMHVAYEDGYTPEVQLAVWHQHLGKSEEAALGRMYGRKVGCASEAYFRKLFESVRATTG